MVKRKWIKISVLTAVISAALFIGIYVLVQNARKNAPSYERHMAEILQMEQTDLTGTISGIRTGVSSIFPCVSTAIFKMQNLFFKIFCRNSHLY